MNRGALGIGLTREEQKARDQRCLELWRSGASFAAIAVRLGIAAATARIAAKRAAKAIAQEGTK